MFAAKQVNHIRCSSSFLRHYQPLSSTSISLRARPTLNSPCSPLTVSGSQNRSCFVGRLISRNEQLLVCRTQGCVVGSYLQRRSYCDTPKEAERAPYRQLTRFAFHVFPNPINAIRGAFMLFLTKSYFDTSFRKDEFLRGVKLAAVAISNSLADNDLEALEGMVTSECLEELKPNLAVCTDSEREQFRIHEVDVGTTVVCNVGIMYDKANTPSGGPDKRYVEIVVSLHATAQSEDFRKELKGKSVSLSTFQPFLQHAFTSNYRFIREYTKGVEDSWVINKINYYNIHNLRQSN